MLSSAGVFFKKDKPRERFYLFPGQGGRNYHRKQRRLLSWAIFVAVLAGAALSTALWWFSKLRL
jgi:hypothetical protein